MREMRERVESVERGKRKINDCLVLKRVTRVEETSACHQRKKSEVGYT